MADHSDIEWTDATWNPITGCSILSPGCTNCYAMKLAGTRLKHHPSRRGLTRDSKAGPVWTGEVRLNEGWLLQPIEWKRSRRIFVCAHGDLFHEDVPDAWIDKVFAVMALAPQHTFQVLTKRAKRMREYFSKKDRPLDWVWHACQLAKIVSAYDVADADTAAAWHFDGLPNVWLGVSAERQQEADERIPELLETPAAVRFLSAEPLLGPIDLTRIQAPRFVPEDHDADWKFDALTTGDMYELDCGDGIWDSGDGPYRAAKLDLVIAGGENGPRPMHPAWARALRDQCAGAGVAFHFKQWGSWVPICATDDAFTDTLYHPAPRRDPDGRRRCKVNLMVLHADGTQFRDVAEFGAYAAGSGAMLMFDVGKGRAGRLLDGVEHDGMPERAP